MIPANPDPPIDEIEEVTYTSLPRQQEHRLLLDLPIFWRLMLGFLSAALIAVLVAGVVGVQRTTDLSSQSNFYQSLVQTNATLTNGATLLQLITSKTNEALAEASRPVPSEENLATTLDTVHSLIDRYDIAITSYTTNDILIKHPEQVNRFSAADHAPQVKQQLVLANNAVRMWEVYQSIQEQVLQFIVSGNVQAAQYTQRFQAEPANVDALSAVNALIQFNQSLATSAEDVENVETQHTLIISIVSAILAFLIIILIGIFVSRTLAVRLKQLLRVIQAVEHGDVTARVAAIGHDEIGQVSASTNTMLETMLGLREETRQQQNVLVNAAEHLLSDTTVVSVNDLRMETTMYEDPIGMLASALNFTIGRLSRLVQHTQSATKQLDPISYRELEHARSLLQAIAEQKQDNGAKQFHIDLAISAPQSSSSPSEEAQSSQITTPAQDQIMNAQHISTQFAQDIIYLANQQVMNIQYMSTQFAQDIIYLANQLDSLAEDLKQFLASLQDDVIEKRDQGESPGGAFRAPFSKPEKDAYSPAFPFIPDFVRETPVVRKE